MTGRFPCIILRTVYTVKLATPGQSRTPCCWWTWEPRYGLLVKKRKAWITTCVQRNWKRNWNYTIPPGTGTCFWTWAFSITTRKTGKPHVDISRRRTTHMSGQSTGDSWGTPPCVFHGNVHRNTFLSINTKTSAINAKPVEMAEIFNATWEIFLDSWNTPGKPVYIVSRCKCNYTTSSENEIMICLTKHA